jgi:DNA polymerase (family 10)
MSSPNPTNSEIADLLNHIAKLLDIQRSDPFRTLAYKKAAETVKQHPFPIATLVEDTDALLDLPHIGRSIARTITRFVHTGHSIILDRLEGKFSPEDQFTRIPGIGEVIAHDIHHKRHIETLEELEIAAYDGRLAQMPGMGQARLLGVQNALKAHFNSHGEYEHRPKTEEPSIATLLEVDALYRKKASAGDLKMIAPKRFNPKQEAWLPILHINRDDWHFTALFSNTRRAHELGKTNDWVILFHDHEGDHGQCTVVTETHGPLKGQRVVRGREYE